MPPTADRPAPWPVGWGLRLGPATRRIPVPGDDGTYLLGGHPLRLIRLSPAGGSLVARWHDGRPVGAEPGAGRLARHLCDAGLASPLPGPLSPGGPGPTTPPACPPRIAVVIPVWNRAAGLAGTLQALAAADRRRAPGEPAPACIIVVDDGSSAVEASGIDRAVAACADLDVVVLRHASRRGAGAARNTGARRAAAVGADLIAFLDADCIPRPGWLGVLTAHFADASLGVAAPRVMSTPGSRRLDRYEAARSPLDLGGAPAPVAPGGPVGYLPSAALVVRREVFAAQGGFDEDLPVGEDVDLVWRILASGWRGRLVPGSVVHHPPRPNLWAWMRQRAHYGSAAAPLATRHGDAVAPLRVARPMAAAWASAALAPLGLAPVGQVAAAAWSVRRLASQTALPPREVVGVAATGWLRSGESMATAARRTWWPLLPVVIALRPSAGRRLGCLLTLPLAVEWHRARKPVGLLPWVALRWCDDASYGAGVWAGCGRLRTWRALRPRRA